MNKIYLRLKKGISILLDDGWWSLDIGDMIVLQKIGIMVLNEPYQSSNYIKSDCYITLGIEYKTIKDIKQAFSDEETEYHMKWEDRNCINSQIKISMGAPHYQSSKTLTYFEMLKTTTLINHLPITMEDVFEDVSLQYNRDSKLNKILENE